MLSVLALPACGKSEGETCDEEQEENDRHHNHQHLGEEDDDDDDGNDDDDDDDDDGDAGDHQQLGEGLEKMMVVVLVIKSRKRITMMRY